MTDLNKALIDMTLLTSIVGNTKSGLDAALGEDVDTKYESDLYYDVVIKAGSHKGWKTTYVGMGRMKFIHQDHGEFYVNKGMSNDWMPECWEDFLEFIANIDDAASLKNSQRCRAPWLEKR